MRNLIMFSAAILIATAQAFSQGTAINKTGAAAHNSALLDLSDTTKGILIPRMKKINKLAVTSPATGLMVYQTDDTTGFWYFNGTKWMQAMGSQGSSASGAHYIGELYGGGIVVFVWNNSQGGAQHGLIASLSDLSTGTIWTTPPYQSTFVPAPSQTDGMTNSNAIVAQAGAGTNYAAGLCRNYSATGDGGLNDWYLPSINELRMCYYATGIVNLILGANGFTTATYWSSTETDFDSGGYQNFSNGYVYRDRKYSNYSVRAVRKF